MNDDLLKDRAWIEINLSNLEHNVREIERIIPDKTKIMAVVKANAYGHGMITVARHLNQIGITSFAVATLQEGITLRENNITGDILILGYTSINNLEYVLKYDLIQTVVDLDYAHKLLKSSYSNKVKVYLKINTGMNRIGINYKDIMNIKKLYTSNKLNILGMFSHFCVADSSKKSDIAFSRKQISRFDEVIQALTSSNIEVGKVHLQSSYGILNYSNLIYDYVRPGIILYGVHEVKNPYCKTSINLKPVLSLKARITSIKEINKGDSVSYGRGYKALKKETIATVSIGYADGFPRNVSGKGAKVMVNGQYAYIIGRICMDQLMINITDLANIKVGDIVTLIGDDSEISIEELAFKSQTITHELLCGLNNRLGYVVIDKI